jgi:2-polyprenyl-3-methyl-5-hydroxy-6-metoxy-1,4-benzoquinol methylase
MTQEIIKDIIKWDIINWSNALDFWSTNKDLSNKNFKCLELGGREGGLSLWLAMKGNDVVCSDLDAPQEEAFQIHKKHGCDKRINYLTQTGLQYL